NQETVDQMYLTQSQYSWNPDPSINVPGNIMPNMLAGAAPASKVVYGTGPGGNNPIAPILSTPLQSQGVLFKEVNAVAAGHYGGSIALLQGNTNLSQPLLDRPKTPTIFEFLRKHGGYKATDTWFLGNSLGNSVPLYNHSDDENYGAKYGANMFIPGVTFGSQGDKFLKDAKVYHPQNELSPMYKMKYFLDNSYESLTQNNVLDVVGNTEAEKAQIKAFMKNMFLKKQAGQVLLPPSAGAGADAKAVGYACEVMKEFTPALTVIKIDGPDACHADFTAYLRAIHQSDHAVGFLWDYIQTQIPAMAGNTIMIATPDCGRNLNPNPILDTENNFRAYDHSDANTRRVFTLMAGATIGNNPDKATAPLSSSSPLNTDAAITVGHILGIEGDMLASGYLHGNSQSLIRKL
ncbi:MAG: hypothetical protein ABF240_09815, partial [Flavobacteriales bacterium]